MIKSISVNDDKMLIQGLNEYMTLFAYDINIFESLSAIF